MDKEQLLLFEELKDCQEDLSGVDGDGLGEGEEISLGEFEEEMWAKSCPTEITAALG